MAFNYYEVKKKIKNCNGNSKKSYKIQENKKSPKKHNILFTESQVCWMVEV